MGTERLWNGVAMILNKDLKEEVWMIDGKNSRVWMHRKHGVQA